MTSGWADDTSVYTVREVQRPESPYAIQPPGNAKYFRSDISRHAILKQSSEYLAISLHENRGDETRPDVGPILMFLAASREENEPLNQNPEFIRQSTGSIANWSVKCSESLGLRIDEFRQGKSFDIFARFDPEIYTDRELGTDEADKKGSRSSDHGSIRSDRYTRIALTEGHSVESTVTLSTDLLVEPTLEKKELEFAILIRADRTTNINARLLRGGKVLSCVGFSAETHWTEVRRQFTETLSQPRHKTTKYQLQLEVVHRGRGYIDLIACSVSTNPSIQTVLMPGRLSKKKGQETADAWRIECKPEASLAAQVSLVQLNDQYDGLLTTTPSKFGMNVRTQSFDGSMRLVSVIGRDFQNCQSVALKLTIHNPNRNEAIRALRKICLIGKRVGSEEILHVFTRKPQVDNNRTIVFKVSEKELVDIRNKSSKYSNIQLCLDLEENTNIVVSSVEVYDYACEDESTRPPKGVRNERQTIKFEDPSITEQVVFLKGLDSWATEKPPQKLHKKQLFSTFIGKTSSIEIARPKLIRPKIKYPTLDIIVPVHNALAAVQQCMLSIIEETTVPYILHCIDDASDSETHEWLQAFCDDFQQVQLHTNKKNIGYTRSVNRGLTISNADWVCVLNSDAIVTSHWLESLVSVTSSDSVGALIHYR